MQVVTCKNTNCKTPMVSVEVGTGQVFALDSQQYARIDEKLVIHKKTRQEPLFNINDRVSETCPLCQGKGSAIIINPQSTSANCEVCGGTGKVSLGIPITCPGCGAINRIS